MIVIKHPWLMNIPWNLILISCDCIKWFSKQDRQNFSKGNMVFNKFSGCKTTVEGKVGPEYIHRSMLKIRIVGTFS